MKTSLHSCQGIRSHIRGLRAERDRAQEELMAHLQALQSKRMRGTLMKDAVYDAVMTTRPFKFISGIFKNWNR